MERNTILTIILMAAVVVVIEVLKSQAVGTLVKAVRK